MPQPVLALEVDAGEIKAAVVEASFRDSRVLGLYREPIARDGSSLAEQLKRFVAKHSLPEQATVLSALPGDAVVWRNIEMPFRDRKRLEQTVPFELEAQVPFALDEVVIDYHVLSRQKEGSRVVAALAPEEQLESHLHVLQEAGLDPKSVDVAPLACLNALALSHKALPTDFVFLSGNERRVNLAVYRGGALVGVRTVVGVNETPAAPPTEPDEAPEAEAEAASSPVAEVVDVEQRERDVFADVRWSIVALHGGLPAARTPCLVWGDGPVFERLGQMLSESLDLDIRPYAEGPSRRIAQPWSAQVAAFTVPLGLAMHEVTPNTAIGVNFRKGRFAYHRIQDQLRAALWRTAALAAVVLAMIVGHTVVEQQRLAGRATAIRGEISKVFKATLADVPAGIDPVTQLRNIIDVDQKKLEMLGDVVPIDGATAIDAMRELAIAIPAELRVDIDEFTMDTGEIRIRATSDSFETVDTIKQRVEERNYFGAVDVRNVKSNREGGVGFLLLLQLGRAGGA